MARPTTFDPEIMAKILVRLADGESLRSICRDDDIPSESTVRGWIMDDHNGVSAQYTRARDLGLDAMADEMLEIADDGTNDFVEKKIKGNLVIVFDKEHVQRSRLRFDARQWYLSKMAPKRYGTDKQEQKQIAMTYEQWLDELKPPKPKEPGDDGAI